MVVCRLASSRRVPSKPFSLSGGPGYSDVSAVYVVVSVSCMPFPLNDAAFADDAVRQLHRNEETLRHVVLRRNISRLTTVIDSQQESVETSLSCGSLWRLSDRTESKLVPTVVGSRNNEAHVDRLSGDVVTDYDARPVLASDLVGTGRWGVECITADAALSAVGLLTLSSSAVEIVVGVIYRGLKPSSPGARPLRRFSEISMSRHSDDIQLTGYDEDDDDCERTSHEQRCHHCRL